jgi:hypothetical protein
LDKLFRSFSEPAAAVGFCAQSPYGDPIISKTVWLGNDIVALIRATTNITATPVSTAPMVETTS